MDLASFPAAWKAAYPPRLGPPSVLVYVRLVCEYMPVRIVARDGQHSGLEMIAWSKYVP